MYCIISTGYNSSTVNASAEESRQRRKRNYLDSYTIVPVTVKELWQRLLENPASEYKNTEWTCDIL